MIHPTALQVKKPVPVPVFCLDLSAATVAPRWTGDGDAFSHSSGMDVIEAFLARIIHEGSSRKRADAKRDGHSET